MRASVPAHHDGKARDLARWRECVERCAQACARRAGTVAMSSLSAITAGTSRKLLGETVTGRLRPGAARLSSTIPWNPPRWARRARVQVHRSGRGRGGELQLDDRAARRTENVPHRVFLHAGWVAWPTGHRATGRSRLWPSAPAFARRHTVAVRSGIQAPGSRAGRQATRWLRDELRR